MQRRRFLESIAAGAASAAQSPTQYGAPAWDSGSVRHILPAASHDRFRIKISFRQPLDRPPRLRSGDLIAHPEGMDTAGLFWAFDFKSLKPATLYTLELTGPDNKRLCAPWPLRTLPHPDERIPKFRVLVYTCAGGHDGTRIKGTDKSYWVPLADRRRMFARAFTYSPDAIIANGDHVYWDQRYGRGGMELPRNPFGDFARDQPVLGGPNEKRLEFAADAQIADLYGTIFRSIPVWFLQDDHDYFENDEASPAGVSFPPDDFMMRLARATRRLYFPEFLPDEGRPQDLPGTYGDYSEAFGTLRWGRAAEVVLYDCRRFLTLRGPQGVFIPESAEQWVTTRVKISPAKHVVNLPSTPMGWSAGKWGEWYPDLLQDNGKLGTAKPKYAWQEGWLRQHDRLLATAWAAPRIPLFVSGDLHAIGHGTIERSGRARFSHNPIHTVLSGPVSTGPRGWPSSARGTPPQVPTEIELKPDLNAVEFNGFTLIDFIGDRIEFQMFRWKLGEPESAIDTLRPFHHFTLERKL